MAIEDDITDKMLNEAYEKSFQRDELDNVINEITPTPLKDRIKILRDKTIKELQETEKSNKVYVFTPSPNGLDEDARKVFLDIIELIASGGDRKWSSEYQTNTSKRKIRTIINKQMRYLLLVILFSLLSCTESIKNGIVVNKEHIEQHSQFSLMPLFNGKTTIWIPKTIFIRERWNIVLRDTLSRESKLEVSESVFNRIEVGNKVTIKGDTILIENN